MKIAFSIRGINSYPYRWPGPAPAEARRRFFSFARDLGAEGVEVEDTWLPFTEMGDTELSEVREEVASFGLSVAALKLGRNNLCLPDERDRNLERTLRALEIASDSENRDRDLQLDRRQNGERSKPGDLPVGIRSFGWFQPGSLPGGL